MLAQRRYSVAVFSGGRRRRRPCCPRRQFRAVQRGARAQYGQRWAPSGDPARAADVGAAIAGYLADIGFNVDFAPVADVLTNPNNPVIGPRSFGSDPQLVGDMVAAQVKAMLEAGVLPAPKHFPGHGDTSEDSHTGAAVTQRTAQELASCEYVPFKKAIAAGCPMVMVGHIQTSQVNGDDLPASLSSQMIDGVLRGELGFEGVVVARLV